MAEPRVTAELASNLDISESTFQSLVESLGRDPTYTELRILAAYWREASRTQFLNNLLNSFSSENINFRASNSNDWRKPPGIVPAPELTVRMVACTTSLSLLPYEIGREALLEAVRQLTETGARPIAAFFSRNVGSLARRGVKTMARKLRIGIETSGKALGVPIVDSETIFEEGFGRSALFGVITVGGTGRIRDHSRPIPESGESVYFLGKQRVNDNTDDLSLGKTLLNLGHELARRSYVIEMKSVSDSGIGVACAKLAVRGDFGITIDLTKLSVDRSGVSPSEMLLSPGTSGLLVVISKGFEREVKRLVDEFDVRCVRAGEVNSERVFRIRRYRKAYAALPLDILNDHPQILTGERETGQASYSADIGSVNISALKRPRSYKGVLFELLRSPNVLQMGRLTERRHSEICFEAPESDATHLLEMRNSGRHMYLDPKTGGKSALAGAARRIVCRGARPTATGVRYFTQPFSESGTFYVLGEAVRGVEEARHKLEIPIVDHGVEVVSKAAFPTVLVGVLGTMPESTSPITSEFKDAGDFVLMLGSHRGELGGSEYLRLIHDRLEGPPPAVDLAMEHRIQEVILMANRVDLLKSAHDVSFGGLSVALVHCLLKAPEGLGVRIHVSSKITDDELLFGETQGLIIITVEEDSIIEIERLCMRIGVSCTAIGRVTDSGKFSFNELINARVRDLVRIHREGLKKLSV